MRQEISLAQTLQRGEWTPRQSKTRLFMLLTERLKRASDASLYVFVKHVLGYQDLNTQPHWELCDFIQRNLWEDCLILTPRGSFKSTVVSIGLPLWLFTKDRNLRLLHESYEMDYTKGWLGVGKQHMESNRLFRLLYGNMAPENNRSDVWRTDRIKIPGRTLFRAECSWIASSIKTSETSQHYDYCIIDDPVNELTIRNPEVMKEVYNTINVVAPLIDPFTRERVGRTTPWPHDPRHRGPRILVGTRWHFADPYGRILVDEGKRRRDGLPHEWKTYIRQSGLHSGKLFFPSRLSRPFLKKMYKTLGASKYSALYENNPLADEAKVYKLSSLGFFNSRFRRTPTGEIQPIPKSFVYITLLDPSRGETDDSAFSAFVTAGIDTDNAIYAWEVLQERIVGNEGIITRLFEIRERWKPVKFGIESYQFQKGIYHSFKAACVARGDWFHIHALEGDTKRSKDMRIEDFAFFAFTRGLYLRVAEDTDLTLPVEDLYYALVPGNDVLGEEMIHFPLAQTKDCLDALSWLPKLVVPGPKPKPKKQNPKSFEALYPHLFQPSPAHRGRLATR